MQPFSYDRALSFGWRRGALLLGTRSCAAAQQARAADALIIGVSNYHSRFGMSAFGWCLWSTFAFLLQCGPVLEADHGFSRPHLPPARFYINESRNAISCVMIDDGINRNGRCLL